MKRFILLIAIIIESFFSLHVYASPELITWTLNNSIPETANINEVYSGDYTFINQSDNDLLTPIYISIKVSGAFLALDKCSGLKLAAKESCKVELSFAPQSAGMHSIELALKYDTQLIMIPMLNSQVAAAKDVKVDIEEANPSVELPMTTMNNGLSELYKYESFTPLQNQNVENINTEETHATMNLAMTSVATSLNYYFSRHDFTPIS